MEIEKKTKSKKYKSKKNLPPLVAAPAKREGLNILLTRLEKLEVSGFNPLQKKC